MKPVYLRIHLHLKHFHLPPSRASHTCDKKHLHMKCNTTISDCMFRFESLRVLKDRCTSLHALFTHSSKTNLPSLEFEKENASVMIKPPH